MVKIKIKRKPQGGPELIRKPVIDPKKVPKKTFHPSEGPQDDKFESKQVNIRLPSNVLDYFRDNYSPGYQTKIKEILTDYMIDNPL